MRRSDLPRARGRAWGLARRHEAGRRSMRRLAPVFLAFLVCACSNAPVRIESRAPADQISRSPEHYIIAAVNNDPAAFVARAGSTPRGYDGIAAYGPSSAARQTMRSLENDYGLR